MGRLGQHPNIVTVYDSGITHGGQPYLLLELCPSSLAERLDQGPLTTEAACSAGAQIADGLAEAHDHQVVHGDLGPESVLIGQTGRFVVTDFGLGSGDVVPEDDVYDLGALLFTMATGHGPTGDAEVCRAELIDLDQPEIADIVAAAMAPAAEDRPTAADLGHQLQNRVDEFTPAQVTGTLFPADEPSGASITGTLFPIDESPSTNTAGTLFPAPPAHPAGSVQAPPLTTGVLEDLNSVPELGPGKPPSLLVVVMAELRRQAGLIAAALAVMVILGGATFFMLTRNSGLSVDSEDATGIEAVGGPEASLSGAANESADQSPGGAVGSLDAARPGDSVAASPTPTSVRISRLPTITAARPATTTRPSPTTTPRTTSTARVTTTTTGPSSTSTTSAVAVPNLVLYGANDAEEQLQNLGFTVARENQPSATRPVGEVTGQRPVGGTRLTIGSTVTLIVSSGPPVSTITIPAAVVGQSEAEATSTLTGAGFTNLAPAVTQPSATVPAGEVIGTTPAVGSSIPADTSVTVIVSSGPEAPTCVSVIGRTEADATERFEDAGMTVTTTTAEHATTPDGSVISCSVSGVTAALTVSSGPIPGLCSAAVGQPVTPFTARLEAAGYTVTSQGAPAPEAQGTITDCSRSGASVSLTFSEGPADPDPVCPAVAGLTEAEASAAVLAAGFDDVTITTAPSDTVAEGIAISCTASGTTATLVISSGPDQAELTVPTVVGEPVAAAVSTLTGLGLQVQTTEAPDDDVLAGVVISSNPAAGATVEPGDLVTLQVSSGPPPGQ